MNQPRLLVIGDSIAVQYSPYLQRAVAGHYLWVERQCLDEALRDLDVPSGANNGDSATVLARLRGLQSSGNRPADVLLLNCGLHDVKTNPATGAKQVPPEQYRHNLREIVATVRAMGLELIWVRTTPCDERIHNALRSAFHRFAADCDAYNAVADGVMAEQHVAAIDLHSFTARLGMPHELHCDHVHFHESIRRQQAGFIAGWLIGRRVGACRGPAGASPGVRGKVGPLS